MISLPNLVGTCIAYIGDGRLCPRPAVFVDGERGGQVCAEHVTGELLWTHFSHDETERVALHLGRPMTTAATPYGFKPAVRVPPEVMRLVEQFWGEAGWYNDQGLAEYVIRRLSAATSG